MNYDILVNKENPIDEKFNPGKLISIGKAYDPELKKFTDENILLEVVAARKLREMLDLVNSKFIKTKVVPSSGYRSYEKQIEIMNFYIDFEGEEKARKRVALPGVSEHHTGLAVDLAVIENGEYNEELTGDEDPIKYLHENSYKFGYILRYPSGKEEITGVMSEPWHFRYVGEELAKFLYDNNLTLEEYYKNN